MKLGTANLGRKQKQGFKEREKKNTAKHFNDLELKREFLNKIPKTQTQKGKS